jgi:hypothetical protein
MFKRSKTHRHLTSNIAFRWFRNGLGLAPFWLVLQAWTCWAEPVAPTLHDPNRLEELRQYYRERLVRIEYNVRNKALNGREETIRGTGFIVSPNGFAITARHVLQPLISDQYERVSDPRIIKSKGEGTVQLKMVDTIDGAPAIKISALTDIATFYVASPGGAPLNFLCVDFDNAPPTVGAKVTVATWEFLDLHSPEWEFLLNQDAEVVQSEGPGPLLQKFEVTQPFHESMSGGAILQADQVIGVVSLQVEENGRPVGYGNYGALLRFATDVGWERAKRCGPAIADQQSLQPYDSFDSFVKSTSEGDLAVLIPDGQSGKYWNFPTDGNYALRPKDLRCDPSTCRCAGQKPEKTVDVFINSRRGDDCKSFASICLSRSGVRTFYGAQVVPVFASSSLETRSANPNTWLFRNALFSRTPSGHFSGNSQNVQNIARKPSRYNDALSNAETFDQAARRCSARLSAKECGEVWSIRKFEEQFASRWHGFPRTDIQPKSTLYDSEINEAWSVPQLWLSQDVEVKNWILAYKTTQLPQTPVRLSFCTNSDWQGFYIRAFSPERGVRTNSVHVYFDTSE